MRIDIRHTATTAAWDALLHAHASVTRKLDAELRRETGLTIGWYEVMLELARSDLGTLRMTDLARRLVLSKSSATRMVDRLEERGLVERRIPETDRRGMEVSLTKSGARRFVEAGRVHLRGIEEHFGAHVSADEAEVLTRSLSRVVDHNADTA